MFERCNTEAVPRTPTCAHGGVGTIGVHRVLERSAVNGALNFIDVADLPPGTSIGRHRHGDDEEEYYLVLAGHGTLWRDGDAFQVGPGDLIRNRPGGAHGLTNTGAELLRLFVFEVQVHP